MSKKLVIANWKMNPNSLKEASEIFEEVKKTAKAARKVHVVVCPPFVWLGRPEFKEAKNLDLGAQNCHWDLGGAYTGEISASMLADLGVSYVIIGHSERRYFMSENDEIINLKIRAALKAKLKVILCVGEREGEEMKAAVETQLTKGLAGLSINQMKEIIIAYEPVWAIGTGSACLADAALSATLFIRRVLTQLYSRFLADKIPILYGGSVEAGNCAEYLLIARMNGLLVGGASLDGQEFSQIINNSDLE